MKTQRIIPIEIMEANEQRWHETKKPELLKMLRKADERIYQVIISNTFTPFKEELGSCFIYGNAGVGKSVNVAWRMLEWSRLKSRNGKIYNNALFTTVGELLQEIKDSFKPSYVVSTDETESEIILKYKNIDLLVLDDFGAEKSTDWNYSVLYLIINYRYAQLKPTMYTSNFDLDAIAEKLGDSRITSRINHDCGKNVIFVNSKSKRI